MQRRWLTLFLIIAVVLVIDQVTKRLVVDNMQLYQTIEPVPALVPFFQITYSQNTGAAFGFLPQAGDAFMVIAVVVVAAMLYFYPRTPSEGHITRFAIGLICGGALGNVIDRLQYGYVVDFIHYQIPNLISNVSNLADHAVVAGVILIFIESWLLDRRQQKATRTAALEMDVSDEG